MTYLDEAMKGIFLLILAVAGNFVAETLGCKSQKLLSLAISKQGDLVVLNSAADLYKIDANLGRNYWSTNTLGSLLPDATDFFYSSNVVITDNEIIFSAGPSTYSYNLNDGMINWESEISSIDTPIIDGDNIFFCSYSNRYSNESI